MRRKTFDLLATAGGAVLALVLIAAGSLGLWASNYANSNVHDQLAMQQVQFPAANSSSFKALPKADQAAIAPYAGQEVLTGSQAAVYANNYIAVHLSEMPYHGVYSQISAAARAATPGSTEATQLEALVQTSFQGTTLRAMLLEAYAFGTMGQIAFVGALVSFSLAFVMLLLTLFGVWHFLRTPAQLEFPRSLHQEERVPVAV